MKWIVIFLLFLTGCTSVFPEALSNLPLGGVYFYGSYPECGEIEGQAEWKKCIDEIIQKEGRPRQPWVR